MEKPFSLGNVDWDQGNATVWIYFAPNSLIINWIGFMDRFMNGTLKGVCTTHPST